VRFTVTILNAGNANVTGAHLRDPLPVFVDYINATATRGTLTYDAASHAVIIDIGLLTPGQSSVIEIETRVNNRASPPPVDIHNLALLSFNEDVTGRGRTDDTHVIVPKSPGKDDDDDDEYTGVPAAVVTPTPAPTTPVMLLPETGGVAIMNIWFILGLVVMLATLGLAYAARRDTE
jgi:uncharacterized repeat protein (TIGR01451 family)